MKYFSVLIIVFLFACNSRKSGKTDARLNNLESHENNVVQTNNEVDTTSFQYYLNLTNKWGALPRYLVDSFVKQDRLESDDYDRTYYGNERRYFKIGGIYIASVDIGVGGVCGETVLITYDKNGHIISELPAARHCDENIGGSTNYEIFSDTLIEITTTKIKPEYSELSDQDTVDYTNPVQDKLVSYTHYTIKQTGIFEPDNDAHKYTYLQAPGLEPMKVLKEEVFYNIGKTEFWPSIRILDVEQLRKLDKGNLRLLRNEIFARHGYQFKSPDLQNYFSKKEWYEPMFADVTSILSNVEKYNVSLIKRIEEE